MSQGLLRGRGRTRPRNAIIATGLVCGLLTAGCTYTTDSTGPGTLVVHSPGTVPAVPPPAPPGPIRAAPTPPPSGIFEGTARLTNLHGSGCRRQIDVTHFVVSGDRARYMGFRGTIRPDGSVRMQSGPSYITGHFTGDRFVGRFWRPQPSCTYDLELRRID
jgi:hypothetical protein